MYRRVVVPALLAIVVPLVLGLCGMAIGYYSKHVFDATVTKRPGLLGGWLPPSLPTGWATFLAIFFAVRMCVVRGGNRRECLLVALSPVIIVGIELAGLGMRDAGMSWPLLALGSMRPVLTGSTAPGTALSVHGEVGSWLNLVATAIAALWLYLFVARQPLRLPAADVAVVSSGGTASAQSVASADTDRHG
ncbi:MAG: hypothetical protein ABSD48_19515 [Armatimonadota bacterium]